MKPPYRNLKFRHYRLVQEIAESGQLSVAAERLAITQPAASRALKDVEAALGQPVFDRHPKGMSATPAGEVLIRHATSIVNDIAHAEEELRAFDAGRTGAVRIGAVTGAAVGYIVPAIQALEAGGSDVSVDVSPSTDLMRGLLNGEFDFVLSRLPSGTDARKLEILGGRVEELRFLVRSGHPLLNRSPLEIADLRDLTWVSQGAGMPIRDAIEQAFLAENVPPPTTFISTPSFLFMTAFLRTSDAVTVVAREVAELLDATQQGHLRSLHMRTSIVLTPYHLIRDRSRRLNPLAERLLDLVVSEMAMH